MKFFIGTGWCDPESSSLMGAWWWSRHMNYLCRSFIRVQEDAINQRSRYFNHDGWGIRFDQSKLLRVKRVL